MIAALAVLLVTVSASAATALVSTLPDCTAGQLSLSVDGERGNFDGMSQSGVLLVLRNFGPRACKTAKLPALIFQDTAHRVVNLERRAPTDARPGAAPPVGIAAGAEATAKLHWVSGDVYAGHHCLTPAAVSVRIGSETVTVPFSGRLCGPAGAPVTYDQAWLEDDPILPFDSGGSR